jgi:hypothetical protein
MGWAATVRQVPLERNNSTIVVQAFKEMIWDQVSLLILSQ